MATRDSISDRLPGVQVLLGYQVVSIKTAARFAGVSVAHMHRAAKGELPNTPRLKVFRVGRRVLTRTDWLDTWMQAEPLPSGALDDGRIDPARSLSPRCRKGLPT